jgi:hypothetical protein
MPLISLDSREGSLEVSSYEGSFDDYKSVSSTGFDRSSFKESPYDFFRERDNHAYIQRGSISYEGDCNNNLIVSSQPKNKLVNVRNAFIFSGESHVEIMPVFKLQEVIGRGRKVLVGKTIKYHIPERVLKRENLPEADFDRISREIKDNYGIESTDIRLVNPGRSRNGIYLAIGKRGDKFILKYRGEDKEKAELISRILAHIPYYFPEIYPRADGSRSYTIEIEKTAYGLEDFVEADNQKEINLDYFSLVGNHIALLDMQLSNFTRKNRNLEKILTRSEYVTESNIASLYLDLAQNNEYHNCLLSYLNDIVNSGLSDKIRTLPDFLIHRDLNHSNILWRGNQPIIVDSESIGFYKRVNEFIAPLLLWENMGRPNYLDSALPKLINAYNKSSENPLSAREEEILPSLLEYALLKFYVVRSIRREIKDKCYLEVIKKNLQSLGGFND